VKQILSVRNAGVLERFAAGRPLLAFDYDGTLAPIKTDPGAVRVRRRTRRLLDEVARRYPCAVVSGRSRADIMRRVSDLPFLIVVGDHGADWGQPRPAGDGEGLRRWHASLVEALGALPGVEVERKQMSLAVHYRRAPRRAAARAAIRKALLRLRGARSSWGRCVVNITEPDVDGKRRAVELACERLGCRSALFLGDDVNDEEAFFSRRVRVLGVRVGWSRTSRARWYLERQTDVDLFLQRLLAAGATGDTPASGTGSSPPRTARRR
jgi:trehalose 6-phosphate phosphatase